MISLKKSVAFVFVAFFALLTPVFAKNSINLFDEEKKDFDEGELIIRVLNNPSFLSLKTDNKEYEEYLQIIRNLKPTYLCECIKKIPYKGHEDLLNVIDDNMLDIPSYVKIPYYSEYNDVHTVLFLESVPLTMNKTNNNADLTARFYMPPFDRFNIELQRSLYSQNAIYKCENITSINYIRFFRAVSKKNMKVSLFIWNDGESWYLYSIGAIKTFKFPFVEKRIRMAIVNRLKDFATYFVTLI